MSSASKVDFEFSRDWVHAGNAYKAGDKIQLDRAKLEKMMSLGAGKPVAAKPASKG